MASADRLGPILARLHLLHPRLIDLSLGRLLDLLAKLDHPERRLPPLIHVAGTNGKGSTCAFLRAIGEAAGLRVHVYTSPHLIRFNERIRLAGEIVSDETLAAVLEEIETVNDGAPITVFEIITAAALVLFARIPADLCVLERGDFVFDEARIVDRPELRWSPYHGRRMRARVAATLQRGRLIWDGTHVLARPGDGRFVRRATC